MNYPYSEPDRFLFYNKNYRRANITRVSYNKAIDSHTLFIDAEGDEEQLAKADKELANIGYLPTDRNENSIVLIEFILRDVPGSVTEVLKLINRYELNISYISSQASGRSTAHTAL